MKIYTVYDQQKPDVFGEVKSVWTQGRFGHIRFTLMKGEDGAALAVNDGAQVDDIMVWSKDDAPADADAAFDAYVAECDSEWVAEMMEGPTKIN